MDIEALKSYLNCDNAFLSGLIQKFIDEVRGILAQMEEAGKKENWPVIRANAHKMLSSVRIFELTELVEILERMEISAASAAHTTQMQTDLTKLLGLADLAIKDMQAAMEELD